MNDLAVPALHLPTRPRRVPVAPPVRVAAPADRTRQARGSLAGTGALVIAVAAAPWANSGNAALAGPLLVCAAASGFLLSSQRISPAILPFLALPLALAAHAAIQCVTGLAGIHPPGSIAPLDTAQAALRVMALALFFAMVPASLGARAGRHQVLLAIYLIIIGHAVGAVLMPRSPEGGLSGVFVGRNAFASFVGMGLLIGLSLGVRARRRSGPALARRLRLAGLWSANILLLAVLVMTMSRLGLGATLVSALVVLALRAAWTETGLLVVVAGAMLAAFGDGLQARLLVLPQDMDTRLALYAQIVGLIADRPLTGYGADSFALAFEAVHRPPVVAEFVWDRAHSTYLRLWVECGVVVGSLPVVAGLAYVWRVVPRGTAVRRKTGPAAIALGALCLAGVHSVFDFSFEILANQLVLLTLLALCAAGADRAHSEEKP